MRLQVNTSGAWTRTPARTDEEGVIVIPSLISRAAADVLNERLRQQAVGRDAPAPAQLGMRQGRELTNALARALGLPKHTTRAVLTLEANRPPQLELTVDCIDSAGRPIVEELPGAFDGDVVRRLAQVRFMVRLERFPDLPEMKKEPT